MSYAIGKRINEYRTARKVSQEDVATKLGISRQRFARIENGTSDISYEMLKKLADFLAVPISDITSADEDEDIRVCFRDVENSDKIEESVEKIYNILKTFHAHEKLYLRMKEKKDEI